MDTGNKTLAQLSEEGKEARYVTLDVGAKISGYTKDYLERLCRLHKVNYLERNIGEHVIELESLLKETHTILLSYEGLTFVDKSELTAPSEAALLKEVEKMEDKSEITPPPYSTQVPNFAQNGRDDAQEKEDMFSFTGRAVVSDAHHPEATPEKQKIVPASTELAKEPVVAEVLPPPVTLTQKKSEPRGAPRTLHNVVHIPIAGGEIIADDEDVPAAASLQDTPAAAKASALPEEQPPVETQPQTESTLAQPLPADEWDERLLGAEAPPDKNTATLREARTTPSPYHPIVTSLDPRDHHEDLPLFPVLIPKEKTPLLPPKSFAAAIPSGEHADANHLLTHTEAAAPVEAAQQAPRVAGGSPLFGGGDQPQSLRKATSSLPMMRVMPQLPMMPEEHRIDQIASAHLTLHSGPPMLTKSLGFNIAFMAFLALSSFWLLAGTGGTSRGDLAGMLSKQMAAVGETFNNMLTSTVDTGSPTHVQNHDPIDVGAHEFSDEVTITEGETFGTLLVQPIFKDGTGNVTEYTITPVSGN